MPRVGNCNPGRLNKWVTLSQCPQLTDDSDGWFEPLDPVGAWVSIKPTLAANGRTTEHIVEMRHHPQVSVDTRIVYEDSAKPVGKRTRELFVKGVQNVDEMNDTLVLICEEVAP